MSNGFNCSHPDNMYRYVQDFTCTNTLSTERMLKEMRLSFPSGHASFGGFALLYCVVSTYSSVLSNWLILTSNFFSFIVLFTSKNEMARVHLVEKFPPISLDTLQLVHWIEPYCWLQASLVRCFGWLPLRICILLFDSK